ncbi:WD40 repeat-like protein [Neolentinus lepideus HHB14362 ss-1]|uniref:WD40 repeat-like protein n=1 Tax=Neolentinus lepideus HHB14362 ss-1 TaxID=1314782 RepID=A0A165TP43_9AGAM|nr:WD40 repeat-like protein [Neolentinus lepideus HHB14362 ss-1]
MLPSPETSPRPALGNRTNVPVPAATPLKPAKSLASIFCLPTPAPDRENRKRPCSDAGEQSKKRVKIEIKPEDDDSWEDETDVGSDMEMEDVASMWTRCRNRRVFEISRQRAMGDSGAYRPKHITTRPILQSFVSSHKSDTYKCLSILSESDLTPPYTCQYSHAAKIGRTPHLAVATEQGTVYIYNTARRQDWEYEAQRATLQPHRNGIFALSWSPSDVLLATSSGDHVTRVTDVTTGKTVYTLQKHLATVKCNAWDPRHEKILSTGGRDGSICVWDLRTKAKKSTKEGGEILKPVVEIMTAHGGSTLKESGKRRGKNTGQPLGVRSITNILYPDVDPYGFVTSGSFDGILRHWDIRSLPNKNTYEIMTTFDSPSDPTTFTSSRPRGIISLTAGCGPTSGLLFALGIDSKIHTYSSSTLAPLSYSGTGSTRKGLAFDHPNMHTNDFYVRTSTSPCGCWIACGGASTDGRAFLFDVSSANSASVRYRSSQSLEGGVELRGAQSGNVGALDWAADGMLATCADNGTVRVWRPDPEVWRRCKEDPEEGKWDWSWAVETC